MISFSNSHTYIHETLVIPTLVFLMDNLCVQFVEKMCHSWHIKGSPCNLRNADSPCYRLASQASPHPSNQTWSWHKRLLLPLRPWRLRCEPSSINLHSKSPSGKRIECSVTRWREPFQPTSNFPCMLTCTSPIKSIINFIKNPFSLLWDNLRHPCMKDYINKGYQK